MNLTPKTQKIILTLAHPAFHGVMLAATLVATVMAIVIALH
jgi:hypothetical protein